MNESGDGRRTLSGIPIAALYAPEGLAAGGFDPARELGAPGEFPFTRGAYPTMHRGRLWTRRQIAGFGTAQATNQRYRFLLAHGQTGLSTDFDHPTLTGYDSDHELAEGEVGRLGVAIDTAADMGELFDGIPLEQASVSLTINHPAIVLLAMFLHAAERRGIPWPALRGTVQNDSLKEFHGQKTFALPPAPALKLTTDVIEFATQHAPNWYTVSISGYHTREAGADAVQELAFTIAQGMAYVEAARERGLPVDAFAPRLSHFFGVHNDFFEEIAKFRAARRMWARAMRDRYGASRPEAMRMRFHAQTLGSTLVRPDPLNNILRGGLQALAAVLGGVQSLHISGYDEAYDIPSEAAMRVSLASQLILAHESGVAATPDPLGGSAYLETLTNELEGAALAYIERIDEMGQGSMRDGMLAAIANGYIESEIAQASYRYQQRVESGEYTIVGVNDEYAGDDDGNSGGGSGMGTGGSLELFEFDYAEEERQLARLRAARQGRSESDAAAARRAVAQAARDDVNLMPAILTAVADGVTEGEIMGTLREVWGEYVDPGVF